MDYNQAALDAHRTHGGKWEIHSKVPLETSDDLSVAYTPGVAAVCEAIAADPAQSYPLTMKGNTVAIVSDGTAVLGLGNIGAEASLPVMEGKALLFKRFANIDGIPIVLNTTDPDEIIATVRAIAPTFGGINLEDIAAPACFIIEKSLQDLGIPVFHDDQHGTAIVLLAALLNASTVVGKKLTDMRVVINGAGAAGTAIARLLRCVGHDASVCESVGELIMCDSKGIIGHHRDDLNDSKKALLAYSNHRGAQGLLADALVGADVFIGVSRGNLLDGDSIRSMAPDPIVFAMANPIPEIMPDCALAAGAAVVGTGRSDFPNQVNNVLVFPGIFRGALNARAPTISEAMKLAAAHALANAVATPRADKILPGPFEPHVADIVAAAVEAAANT